jgi:DNA-binding MarR family transcriptional regulator
VEQKTLQDLINRYIRVSFSVTKKGESLIKEQIGCDLTADQHYTLRYIKHSNNCTSTELAEAFDVQKSAITAIITRLTDKGFIERTRDKNDRRVVYLTLTEKGNILFNESEQRVHQLVERFISKFQDEEIHSFINTYEKLEMLLIDIKEGRLTEENESNH